MQCFDFVLKFVGKTLTEMIDSDKEFVKNNPKLFDKDFLKENQHI